MDKLKEKTTRRKDQGFTLIELMIVIAVIGILAIVLVPKVGTIKTQAKGAGIETNVRMVQGYLQSKVSRWVDQGTEKEDVAKDVYNAFNSPSENEKMKNPFSQKDLIKDKINDTGASLSDNDSLQILGTAPASYNPGSTVVIIPSDMDGNVTLTVYGIDNAGTIASTVKVTP